MKSKQISSSIKIITLSELKYHEKKKLSLREKALMNYVNIEYIVFSTVLKRSRVVKSKPYYAQGYGSAGPR